MSETHTPSSREWAFARLHLWAWGNNLSPAQGFHLHMLHLQMSFHPWQGLW